MDIVCKQNTASANEAKYLQTIVTESANEHSEFADADCRPFANYDTQSADNIEH